jgi:WbqC-like protein family
LISPEADSTKTIGLYDLQSRGIRMKTVGIMQPYLLPYLGYFQLIKECDVFVWLDDVQFTRKGWINRNRILLGGTAHEFVFSVQKGAQKLPINERWYSDKFPDEARKFLRTLHMAYHKAPHYETGRNLLTRLLSTDERNVASFNCGTLEALCTHFGVTPEFTRSSRLSAVSALRGEERIIGIVKALGGNQYVNPIGGTVLYSYDRFRRAGLALKFLKSGEASYHQLGPAFVPQLSIVDVLMFADSTAISALLKDYRLLGEGNVATHGFEEWRDSNSDKSIS